MDAMVKILRAMAAILAMLLAVVVLAAPVGATENPTSIARALYATYAEGDAAAFKSLWAEGVTPAHLADLTNEQRVKCIVLAMFQADEPRIDADRAEVPAVVVLSRTSRINGRVSLDVEHATIGMKREHDEWRIDRWSLKEDDLIERAEGVKSLEEARSLVRENLELLDFAFYRGLRRRSSLLINQRKFDGADRLTAAMRELAAMTADDGVLSTAYALDSIVERVGPAPDAAKALASATESLTLAEGFGDPDSIGSALMNVVRAQQWRDGNETKTAPLLERVLTDRSRIEDQGLVSRAAVAMADVHQEHGDYRASLPYLQIAQEIATSLDNPLYLCDVEYKLGDLYAAENDFELAALHFSRARTFAGKIQFEVGYVAASQMLARSSLRLGRTAEFRTAADEVLKRSRDSDSGPLKEFAARALTDMAFDHLQHGDLAHAEASIQEALGFAEKGIQDDVLGQALEVQARIRLAQQRYAEAIEAAGRAIGVRSKQKTLARLTPWLLAAQAHLALGDRVAAYEALRAAVDYGEQERAGIAGSERQLELLFEPTAAAYVMLVDLLIEDRRYDEAFLVAEKAKSRALLDVLNSERSSAEHDVPPAEIAEEQRLEQNLVAANRNAASAPADVARARVDLESYRAVLDGRYPRLHAARGAGTLTALSSVAPLLSDGKAALIEYVVSRHQVHLFVVQPGEHAGEGPRLTVRSVAIEH
jgi:tetratricopeptide (TPR) repeat protein